MYNTNIEILSDSINFQLVTDQKIQLSVEITMASIRQFLYSHSFVELERVKVLYDHEGNDCLDEMAIERNEAKITDYINYELSSVEIIAYMKEFIRCL